MKQRWLAIKQKYEAFEMRERALLLGALLAAIYMLWDLLFVGPLAKDVKLAKARERVALQNINATETEIDVLQKLASKDPNVKLKVELDALNEQIEALDERLSELSAGLVSADQLPVVLHDLLASSDQLKLIATKTLPVAEVKIGEAEASGDSSGGETQNTEQSVINVYRHGVSLKVEGSYLAVYNYLKRVEQSSWHFYWDSIEYKVSRYPQAEVLIEVFTLSPEQGIFNG